MSLNEWLSKSDPTDIDVNTIVSSTLRCARAATPITAAARALPSHKIADALKEGASAMTGGDMVMGAQQAAATMIALNTSYDISSAERIVGEKLNQLSADDKSKLDQTGVAESTAEAIADAVGSLPGIDVSLDLSKPSPLNAPIRVAFSAGSLIALLAAIALTGVAGIKNVGSSGFFAALAVIGFLLVVATLVFVMGYGSVKVNTKVGTAAKSDSES